MTRLILVAAGGLLLATASAPPPSETGDYPTCTAKITDRCIQRHERGTYSARRAEAPVRKGGESELSSVVAAEAPGHYAKPAPAPAYSARPAAPAPTYAARPAASAPTYAARPAAPAPTYAARPAATRRAAHSRAYRLALRAGERG